MIIIGIDPGLNKTGWGVIEYHQRNNSIKYIDSGILQTKAADALPMRLHSLASALEKILQQYQPQHAGLEEVFINNNALSSMKLCHARGTLLSTLYKYTQNIAEFAPNKVKKTIVGTGRADKNQVKHMVSMILPNAGKMKSLDESDALAIAYCAAVHLPLSS